MSIRAQTEEGARKRVKGFDRVRKISSFHIYRLHNRAKKYSEQPEDEERYFRTLKILGYLLQVEVAAQRSAFEQEVAMVEAMLKDFEETKADYARLKRQEEEHIKPATGPILEGSHSV